MIKDKIKRIVSEKYTASFMNDSKWYKLIDKLTECFEDGVHVNYKLIYDKDIRETVLYSPDLEPFFIEPTVYSEIEWLEVPSEYIYYVNPNNKKAGDKIYTQNISGLENELSKVGEFVLDVTPSSIKIIGYR